MRCSSVRTILLNPTIPNDVPLSFSVTTPSDKELYDVRRNLTEGHCSTVKLLSTAPFVLSFASHWRQICVDKLMRGGWRERTLGE